MQMDLPLELLDELKAKAKKAGMDYDQFVSLLLKDAVVKKLELEEVIGKTVRKVLLKEIERDAPRVAGVLRRIIEKKPLSN